MGIPGLWDVIGGGEIRHVADYASDHFKQHGRSLRIAVDEATWRFTNLTDEQVQKIREGEPAANPIEKVILWRILRLWRLNIQLLFVWDGLRKPGKERRKGPGGGKVDHEVIKMLHRMFDTLRVPYHQAPGEAEAECARLQQLGIVDAVWSDDGDSLMFGCQVLIKQYKVAGKAVKDHIQIYRAAQHLEKLDLDHKSLAVFALISGGDYDTTGLRGCGPGAARMVCKRAYGLGRALANVELESDLPAWRDSLVSVLQQCRKNVEVPKTFPSWKVFKGYRDPAISTDEQLHNLRALRKGWWQPIDEYKLRDELRAHYNFKTREYLKHIAPVFLTRKLVNATTSQQKEENLTFQVQMKRTRKPKTADGEDAPARSEAKILYSAASLVGIDVTFQPPDEDWTAYKDGPYDPLKPIDCEIPSCFLAHGLPKGSYETPPASKRGGRTNNDPEDKLPQNLVTASTGSERHGESAQVSQTPIGKTSSQAQRKRSEKISAQTNVTRPKRRKGASQEDTLNPEPRKRRKRKSMQAQEEPTTCQLGPPSQFRVLDISDIIADAGPRQTRRAERAQVIDLCDEESERDDFRQVFVSPMSNAVRAEYANVPHQRAGPGFERAPQSGPQDPSSFDSSPTSEPGERYIDVVPLAAAPRRSGEQLVQQQQTAVSASLVTPPTSQTPVPGEPIDMATLRKLRLAAILGHDHRPEAVQVPRQHQTPVSAAEVIDVT